MSLRHWPFALALIAVLALVPAASAAVFHQDPGYGGGSGGGSPCGEPQCGCTAGPGTYVCSYSCGCAGGQLVWRNCITCTLP